MVRFHDIDDRDGLVPDAIGDDIVDPDVVDPCRDLFEDGDPFDDLDTGGLEAFDEEEEFLPEFLD